MTTNIFWFRNDLRLADNPGLAAALEKAQQLALVYVLDDAAAGIWAMGGASRWWLHHSLQALGQDIAARGGKLLLRRGDATKIIPELAKQLHAEKVYASRSLEPWADAQQRQVETKLQAAAIGFERHEARVLFPPEKITTRAGGVFAVYTPFSRVCFEQAPPPAPIAAPKRLPATGDSDEKLEAWELLPTHPDWAGGLREAWQPGEAGAQARLRVFLDEKLEAYKDQRNIPGHEGTSRLSPHLHFGEISPGQLWHAVAAEQGPGPATYLRELIWRDFSNYLLGHHPDMPDEPLRPEFAKMPWAQDKPHLAAWQRGRTGIPIIDAGMRQLWQMGWLHNRMRMVCASFLIKHLLIQWQIGEAWYWDTLVDADLGNNSNNWQWVAGCGADAAPYFRIFNPVLQGQKFDPEGEYVRSFVPELARLPNRYIHTPWEAGPKILAEAGITLGETYPKPIIDLGEGRERALAAFRQIREGAGK